MDFVDRIEEQKRLCRQPSLAPFAKKRKIVYVLFLREHPLDNEEINILYPDEIVEMV